MALPLALLEPQWHLFQDWLKGDGTLELQECKVTQINPPSTSPSPTEISENSFSKDTTRTPLPGAEQTFNSLVTQIFGDFSRYRSITDCFSLWPEKRPCMIFNLLNVLGLFYASGESSVCTGRACVFHCLWSILSSSVKTSSLTVSLRSSIDLLIFVSFSQCMRDKC